MTFLFTSGATKYFSYVCILHLVLLYTVATDSNSLYYVKTIDDQVILDNMKNSETLSVVYFSHAGDAALRDSFLQAFEDSAKYLDAYNVFFAMVDCVGNPLPADECKEENLGKNVITYQNGAELIRLEMETMFDVNSIMSNSLQLLLIHEVPIVENMSERENLMTSLRGQKDLLFFYTQAIGTLEHRVYMEIAYIYQDRYKFAVSTKMETIDGLQDHENLPSNPDFALWTVYCSKAPEDGTDHNVPNVLYRGGLTLSALADYMKQLPIPNLFYAPENETLSLFEMESDLPVIYMYTNDEFVEQSNDISKSLSYDVRGFAKIVVVNVDDEGSRLSAELQGFDGTVPQAAVAIPDGKITFMEQKDEFNLVDIRHFLTNVATIPIKPGEEVVNAKETEEEEIDEVLIQDDEVAKAVNVFDAVAKETEITHLPAVLKATFDEVVTSSQLKMVLYFLPFDSVSLASFSIFKAATKILTSGSDVKEDVLASVNCFDASDLCSRENITTYPIIRIHRKDMPHQPYEGHLDAGSVVTAVSLLKHGFPLLLENKDQLHKFVTGVTPTKITDLSPSSVVFVARKKDTGARTIFEAASKQLATFVAMGEAHESLIDFIALKYQTSIPCVVSIHHSDTIQPVRLLSNIVDIDGVVKFVKQSMVATMPELSVSNFPILRAKNLPFVILFLNQSEPTFTEIRSTITNIGSMEEFKDSIFCWMDVQNETLGMKLLSEYTEKVILPTVTVVNHAQAKVFNKQAEVWTPNQITEWLRNVFNGKEEPSKSLEDTEWSPPGPYYDFLTMIDEDEAEQVQQETQATDAQKVYDSGYKVALEKEEEVREKLLERHLRNQMADKEKTRNNIDETQITGQDNSDSDSPVESESGNKKAMEQIKTKDEHEPEAEREHTEL